MSKRKEPHFTDADLKTKPWITSVVVPAQQSVPHVPGKNSAKPSINGKTKTRRKTRLNIPP